MATALPNADEVRDTLKKILKTLECPICLELLSSPYTTAQCSHAFCKACIFKFISSTKFPKCPLCKEKITKRSMVENTRLGEIVEAVKQLETAVISDTGIPKTPPRPLPPHTLEATGTPGIVLHSAHHPSPHKPHSSTPSTPPLNKPAGSTSRREDITAAGPSTSRADSRATEITKTHPPTKTIEAVEITRMAKPSGVASLSKTTGASEPPKPTGRCLSTRSRMRRVRFSTVGKGRSAVPKTMKFPAGGGNEDTAALLSALENADFCSSSTTMAQQHDHANNCSTTTSTNGCQEDRKGNKTPQECSHSQSIKDSKKDVEESSRKEVVQLESDALEVKAPVSSRAHLSSVMPSHAASECRREVVSVLETPAVHLPATQTTELKILKATLKQKEFPKRSQETTIKIDSQATSVSSPTLCIKETQLPATVSQSSSTPRTLTPSSPIPPHPNHESNSSGSDTTLSLSPPIFKTPAPPATQRSPQAAALKLDPSSPAIITSSTSPPAPRSVPQPLCKPALSVPSQTSKLNSVSPVMLDTSLEPSLSPSIPLQDGRSDANCQAPTNTIFFPEDPTDSTQGGSIKSTFLKIDETQLDSVQSSQPTQLQCSASEPADTAALPGLEKLYSSNPPIQALADITDSLIHKTQLHNHTSTGTQSTQQSEGLTGQTATFTQEVTTQQVVSLHQLMADKEREIKELEALLVAGDDHHRNTHPAAAETATEKEEEEEEEADGMDCDQTQMEGAVSDSGVAAMDNEHPGTHSCKLGAVTQAEEAAPPLKTEPSPEVTVISETVPDSFPITSPTSHSEERNDSIRDDVIPPTPPAALAKPGSKRKSPNSSHVHTKKKSLKITPPSSKEAPFSRGNECTPVIKAADRLIRDLRSPSQSFLESQSTMEIDDDLMIAGGTTPNGTSSKGAVVSTPFMLKGPSFKTPKSNPQVEKKVYRSLSCGKRKCTPPPSSTFASSTSTSSSSSKPSQRSRSLHVTPVSHHTAPPIKRQWNKPAIVVKLDSQDLQTESPPLDDPLPQQHPFFSIATERQTSGADATSGRTSVSVPPEPDKPLASSRCVKDSSTNEKDSPQSVLKTPSHRHPITSSDSSAGDASSSSSSSSTLVRTPSLQQQQQQHSSGSGLRRSSPSTHQQQRSMSFIGSGLSKTQLRQAQLLARQNGGRIASCFNGSTTHIIVISDENGCCPRTVKYLLGVAAGKWVVAIQWVLDSLDKGLLQPEVKYEVKGDHVISVSHAPKRSRTSRARGGAGLFTNCNAMLEGDFKNISSELLTQLFSLGGGKIESTLSDLRKVTGSRDCYIVCDDPEVLEELRRTVSCDSSHAPRLVGSSWVLDSLSSYRLQ